MITHDGDMAPVPTLQKGRTARSWMRLMAVGLAGGALCGLGIPAARLVLPQQAWEPAMGAILFVVLVFAAIGLWASLRTFGAIEREREAGYTTLHGRYFELWQLDPKTGEVLRRPGEREVRRRPRPPA